MGKQGCCFHCYYAVYDVWWWWDAFWPQRKGVFVSLKISLSPLWRFISKHCQVSLGDFLRWWPPSAMKAGPSIYLCAGDVWIIPSFRFWDYVLHVERISCVITNCGHHQWVISSPLSMALNALLTLPENYNPYLSTCSSKVCYSGLLSLYSLLSLSFLLHSGSFVVAVYGPVSVGN